MIKIYMLSLKEKELQDRQCEILSCERKRFLCGRILSDFLDGIGNLLDFRPLWCRKNVGFSMVGRENLQTF